jgi:superfamily II DNA/RNA helicase
MLMTVQRTESAASPPGGHARQPHRKRRRPATVPARAAAPGRAPVSSAQPGPTRAAVAQPPASFAALGVPPALVQALASRGISAPFPIQAAALPDALAGTDILGRGRTGSGKTLGFGIPLVARLADRSTSAGRPRGLVLVPTRELARQVHDVLQPLATAAGLSVAVVFGGTSQRPQVAALRDRVDIVVACPGRLADLIDQRHCHLGDVEITVLDEADHMADLGFLPVVRRLLEATPPQGQRMLFSATLDNAVDVLARRFLTKPAQHSVDPPGAPAALVHHLLTISATDRAAVVADLASGDKRSLVFTRTRHGARKLAGQLRTARIPAAELHGDLSQHVREQNLACFSSGAIRVLVATDIAARGIHVDKVELVIHADAPAEHKAYLHRSGRTARAGADGTVVTLQTSAEAQSVRKLMSKAGVVPVAAAVSPGSPVIRAIAGPQVAPASAAVAQLPGRAAARTGSASRARGSATAARPARYRRPSADSRRGRR